MFIIIQARMTSTRLPAKVLLPLCGKTVLEVLLDRLNIFKDKIIIATTDDGTQGPIVNLCKNLGVKYYEGSVENVLERYYKAATCFKMHEKDIIIRITSDCPLIDLQMLENMITKYQSHAYDYLSNRIHRTVPIGLDIEIFNFKLLKKAYLNATEEFEKEHVTPYMYITAKKKYSIGSYEEPEDNSKYRLTLDEIEDYQAIKKVYELFDNDTGFTYIQLIDMLNKHPEIYEINKNVKQKQLQIGS